MDEQSQRWARDSHGRVGTLVPPDRIRYASGEQRAPRAGLVEILDVCAAEYEFAKQRDAMWAACCELDSLNRRVCARFARPGTLRYEELLQDVGLATMRRAVLLHKPEQCSLRGYVKHCLERAYSKAAYKRAHRQQPVDRDGERLDVLDEKSLRENGLDAREQLQTIVERAGLSVKDVSLLMSRFDEEATLRDLAEELDVSSPQTVLNCINRILERCRRAV